jgi:hypothetical protein
VLPADQIIKNDGTLEDLKKKLEDLNIPKEEKKRYFKWAKG